MSDTENIVFKKGLGNLPLPNVENGSVLIETDSGRMYIDDNDVRTQISRKISSGDELPTEGVKEGDIFLKNGTDNGEEDMFNLLYPIVNEHVNADNPHGITREYLGAAKEGYVYKVITDVDTEADLENALNAELATMSGNTVRFLVISPITSNYLFGGCGTLCELYCRTKDYGTAKFTWYSDYKTPNIAYKNIYGGVWDPLAWLNPPMALGAEYRTTERCNGKTVYVKKLNLGAYLESVGTETVKTGIYYTGLVRFHATLGDRFSLPLAEYQEINTWYYTEDEVRKISVELTTKQRLIGDDVMFTVYYTKD